MAQNGAVSPCICSYLEHNKHLLRGGSRILIWGALAGVWGTEAVRSTKNVTSWGWKNQCRLPREKNKSIQTDIVWQYHNYHHLIHSSFYVSSHFCLKIQNAVCELQSQRNGPKWQPGLIKRVSWVSVLLFLNGTSTQKGYLVPSASLLKGTLPYCP